MKWLLILCIAGVVFATWYFLPVVDHMRNCYQASSVSFDDIGYKTKVQNWNEKSICQARFDSVVSLGECLDEPKKDQPAIVVKHVFPILYEIVRLTTPYTKQYEDLKSEHNSVCGQYPDFIIE